MKKRTCDVCAGTFAPRSPAAKRCSRPCRDEAHRRNNRTSPEGREQRTANASLERRLLAAQASAEASKRQVKAATNQAKALEDDLATAQSALALYEKAANHAPPGWLRKPRRKSSKHRGTPIAILSDPHFGEIVDPREMDGYNAYNLAIAEKRLARFFERTILVTRNYLAGVSYDGVVLALNGDIVSGDIHDELTETNELSTYETVEWAVPRIADGIEMFAEEFGRVHVVSAPGNHGRNRIKPRYKRRSANNADSHIARLLTQRFHARKDVTFTVPRSLDATFEVYGYRFSMEHGDEAKGGDGQVGALGPAKRMTLRKQTQAAAEGRPFHYLLLSHFHQYVPAASQGFVMNGSLKGYDEYARGCHFKPEPAQQALMVVTPEHGITVQAPVLVQKRKDEGW